jgi:hypothetical protein
LYEGQIIDFASFRTLANVGGSDIDNRTEYGYYTYKIRLNAVIEQILGGCMSTKVTVNLPDETVDAIKSIAEKRGTTVTEALRQVIEGQRFLQDEMENGNKLLIQNPDQSVRQVVFNTPPKQK